MSLLTSLCIGIIYAIAVSMVSAPLTQSLMQSDRPEHSGQRRRNTRLVVHAITLAPTYFLINTLSTSVIHTLCLVVMLGLLWMLAVMDSEHREVPERVIFVFALVCGVSGVLNRTGTRLDVVMIGLVCTALTIALVIVLSAVWTLISHQQPTLQLGSADTLVLLGLSSYLGMNILYVMFIAAVLSAVIRAISAKVRRAKNRGQIKHFALLPAIFAASVCTLGIEPLLARYGVESLNTTTQYILDHAARATHPTSYQGTGKK